MKPAEEGWLTSDQTRRMLGVSPRQLYALIDSGDLPAYRFGSRIQLRVADVREYLARRDDGPPQ